MSKGKNRRELARVLALAHERFPNCFSFMRVRPLKVGINDDLMPPAGRGGARSYLIFGDIEGKLDVLRVECTRCDRKGRYHVANANREARPPGQPGEVTRNAERRLSEARRPTA